MQSGGRLWRLYCSSGTLAQRRWLLDAAKSWFTDGPQAAPPPTPTTPPPASTTPPPTPAATTVDAVPDAEASSFFVPQPEEALESLRGSAELLGQLSEPTFASLGLGLGFWPTTPPLKLLELLHASAGLPWWSCAVVVGVGVRLVMLYPNMQLQRVMRCDLPRMNRLTEFRSRMELARESNNQLQEMRLMLTAQEEFPEFRNPRQLRRQMIRSLLLPYASNAGALLFVQLASIRAVYRAANLPVASFQSGGCLWFADLTCIDPYFALPAVVTGLLLLNLRMYFRNLLDDSPYAAAKPLAFTLLPTLFFTVLINLPSASLVYFLATGCTAQLLHQFNGSQFGKGFWKRAIGLPSADEVPRLQKDSQERLQALQEKLDSQKQKRGYQAASKPDPSSPVKAPPKTFRIKRQQQRQRKSGIL